MEKIKVWEVLHNYTLFTDMDFEDRKSVESALRGIIHQVVDICSNLAEVYVEESMGQKTGHVGIDKDSILQVKNMINYE